MPTKKSTTTTKKSATKKATSSAKKSSSPSSAKMSKEAPAMTSSLTPTPKSPKINSRYMTIALVVVAIALLVYKFGPYFVPAIVNNRPVTRFELWNRMEKSIGAQTLDDIVNEYTLEAAINKTGIKVDQAKVDEQMKQLEDQFSAVGGLDEALAQRGLTRAELEKQVKTQLAVEEILKDKVEPTEEEIQAYFDDNADTLYADQTFEDVKEDVSATVRDSKLRDAFLEWFAKVKEEASVKNFGL